MPIFWQHFQLRIYHLYEYKKISPAEHVLVKQTRWLFSMPLLFFVSPFFKFSRRVCIFDQVSKQNYCKTKTNKNLILGISALYSQKKNNRGMDSLKLISWRHRNEGGDLGDKERDLCACYLFRTKQGLAG